MVDTVDWVGDGDDDAFFQAIEQIFDIRLRRHLPWLNFGDVFQHLVTHVKASDRSGNACATQMTFYRLRRALKFGRHVKPDAALAELIGENLRHSFADLEGDTGLKMPATRAGWLGISGNICFVVAFAVLALTTLPPAIRIGLAGISGYAGLWLRHLDRRRLPAGCETIGELATMVTDQNRGRLARDGARLTEAEIWRIIQQLASAESGIDPNLIGPETTFFRSTVRAA
jgi:hypothetical protein